MIKILIVEDDIRLAKLISEYLKGQGFAVAIENRGDKAAYRILQEEHQLVILDINLPELDGLQVCKLVRNDYSGLILMLTARQADEDQITGLEYGADDYLSKPIQPKVLLARINTLLRRHKRQESAINQLVFGKLTIDLEKHAVTYQNREIELKPREYELLALLALNAGTNLTRNNITQALRGIDYDGIDRSIDLRISYLRKKLDDDLINPYKIKTIRNKGYMFISDAWD